MSRPLHPHPIAAHAAALRASLPAAAALLLGACASAGVAGNALVAGEEVRFQGAVTAVDLAPWAYDGNARVTVDRDEGAPVVVELPARWNLCRATGIGSASTLAVGQRVQVVGTVTLQTHVSVCERDTHIIRRLP